MGAKHFEKLTKKKIVDKTGRQRTVWVKIGEEAKKVRGKVGEAVKQVKEKVGVKTKEVKKKQEASYDKHEGASLFKKKMKGIVKNIKAEVQEWKSAGVGIKKLVTKSGDLTDHEKKAIKTVAIHAAIVVASSLLTAGGAGVLALGKSIALGYLEHAGILKIGHALAFAKAEDEGDHEEHEAEHYIERMIMSMSNYMEKEANGDNDSKESQQKKQ